MARKMLDKPEEGRPWFKRFTVIFGALAAASASLEPAGVIPPGSTDAGLAALGSIVAGFGALIGMYRQVAN